MSNGDSRLPSRRQLLSLGLGVFVVSLVPLGARRTRRLIRRTLPVMGTLGEITVVADEEHRAHVAIDAAFAALHEVDRTMTRFKSTSDIGRANLRAAREAVPVARDTAVVVREALRWARASDGAFDPSLGKATGLWDPARRREPPAPERVASLAGRRMFEALVLEPGPGLRFLDADISLDLGGIAKGFGVDRAAEVLRAHGIERALVNVGGDLVAIGESEDGDPWRVGVRSASRPGRIERTLDIVDCAVATSGDYERFFRHGGKHYHHLLDPQTAAPRRTDAHSLTVVADTCMTADAGATAAFGMRTADARRLLSARGGGASLV